MINKEGSSVAAASTQSRYFVIDIDDQWRPKLSYYKEHFEAPSCKMADRPEVLGSLNIAFFTFTPTKVPRHDGNGRSWRIDCTGTSKGKSSGSKHDKIVLEFNNDKECHQWQAAFSVCKVGVQKFVEERIRREKIAEDAKAAAAAIRKAEDERLAAAEREAMNAAVKMNMLLSANDSLHQVQI
jgi:hypothetical protein